MREIEQKKKEITATQLLRFLRLSGRPDTCSPIQHLTKNHNFQFKNLFLSSFLLVLNNHSFSPHTHLNSHQFSSFSSTFASLKKKRTCISAMASTSFSTLLNKSNNPNIYGSRAHFGEFHHTHFRICKSFRDVKSLKLKASMEPRGLTRELKIEKEGSLVDIEKGSDPFEDMKRRFLAFKKFNYMDNLGHYKDLSEAQAPKFLVIACADSRVCPTYILGFQPGDAFMIRNIANLVPPHEAGPSEVQAALEFSVNTLEVENILVIGHSCCGGIRALMSMEDEADSSSFIKSWVIAGKNAKRAVKAAGSHLSFDQQCKHCEKESVNCSLLNLLSYPWIEEKVKKGVVSIHGGYYDFVDCTFEKWTLDYKGSTTRSIAVKNRSFWS